MTKKELLKKLQGFLLANGFEVETPDAKEATKNYFKARFYDVVFEVSVQIPRNSTFTPTAVEKKTPDKWCQSCDCAAPCNVYGHWSFWKTLIAEPTPGEPNEPVEAAPAPETPQEEVGNLANLLTSIDNIEEEEQF